MRLSEKGIEAAAATGVVTAVPGCTCPEAGYGPRPDTCRCDERADAFVRRRVVAAIEAYKRAAGEAVSVTEDP